MTSLSRIYKENKEKDVFKKHITQKKTKLQSGIIISLTSMEKVQNIFMNSNRTNEEKKKGRGKK